MRAGVAWLVVVGVLLGASVAHADLAITKVGVRVAPTNASGNKWDRGLGTEPDPKIEVLVGGKRIQACPAAEDTFEADCAVSKQRTFAGAVDIELRVSDGDIAVDDAVGNARGQIPANARGRFDLAVDGKLEAAWVEVEDAAGPSVMDSVRAHIGARSIGGVLGVLIALLLYRLYGARVLSPPDEKRTELPRATLLSKGRGNLDDSGQADREEPRVTTHVNFWRSPILLASAGASIVGIFLANVLRDPHLPITVGSIPYVLGGFGFTAPIIDAYKHQHLGSKRLRLVIAGVAAMFAVPLFDFFSDFFTGIAFLAKHVGWTFVGILLLLCLL
ncbi:MAG TPA: hypothetical protein VIV40_43775 [Kofleriaceae bacterium]